MSSQNRRSAGRLFEQQVVMADVIFRHAPRSKPSLEPRPNTTAVQIRQTFDRLQCLLLIVDDKAGDAMLNNFWDGAAAERYDWRTARHRLDHHQAERLRPIDRKQ